MVIPLVDLLWDKIKVDHFKDPLLGNCGCSRRNDMMIRGGNDVTRSGL